MLSVRDIGRAFVKTDGSGELTVLDGVSFDVADHEFVSILGPSGCGKTTLIRIIAGLIAADSGDVRVDGNPVTAPGPERCMVFQNFGLLPWRNVQSNVEFGLEVFDLSRAERAATAAEFIELVELKGFERYYPHQISGGMQQRVGIARALARNPKILLMDEPFGAVDAQTREQLQEELLRIWNTTDKTVLFVTHSIDEAIFLSDRIVVLQPHPGRVRCIVEVDLPRPRGSLDLQASPGSLRSAKRSVLSCAASAPPDRNKVVKTNTTKSSRLNRSQVRKRQLSPLAIRAISIGTFLILWELFGRRVDPILMSYPSAILVAFGEMLQSGELFFESARSIQSFMAGFGLAIVLGVLVEIAMGANRPFEYAIDPFINALYSTPNVALIPLIILWLGLGLTAKIAIVFLIAFFPIVVSTFAGVKNVSGSLVEIGRAFGLSSFRILWKIILPGSVPFIATGIRLAVGRAVVGMVVAEFFTAISGLGGMIIKYSNKFETDRMFVPIIVLAVFGVVLTEVVKIVERYLAPWKETERLQL